MAERYRVPPSTYLGLGYEPWGRTDFVLTQAREHLRGLLCSCGCGQYADVAHDPALMHEWQIETDTCFAGAKLEEFREHNQEPPPGQLVTVVRRSAADAAKSDAADHARILALMGKTQK